METTTIERPDDRRAPARPTSPVRRRLAIVAAVALGATGLGACARHTEAASPATAAMRDVAHRDTARGEGGHRSGGGNDIHHGNDRDHGAAGERIDPDAFHRDMRKLWEDHVTWTRLFIVSAIAGLPDIDATAGRLLQNQDDIGDAVGAFYGEGAGDALAALLRAHILIAADLVGAAKSGDTAAVTAQRERWYENGDAIAAFLADANPAWQRDTMAEMMRAHLDQTIAEATARLNGDWAADVAEYDRIHLHILDMADALADGIVTQFPRRFSH